MKKYIGLLFILLLTFMCFITPTYAVEKVDASLKVYDFGNLLTPSEEFEIKQMIDDYTNKYKLDMVIVTQSNYSGDMTTYAQDFYDYNEFGVGNTKDGILLFLNVDYYGPLVEICTTGEGIRMYDDARIDSMISSMASVKNQGNGAIVKTFVSDSSKYASYGIPSSNKDTYIDENGDIIYKRSFPVLAIFGISAFVATLVILILISRNKMVRKAMTATEYLDRQSIVFTSRQDQFVNTFTAKTRIDSSSSGGGRVGGSSISRGSSGRSHGGGGRRL